MTFFSVACSELYIEFPLLSRRKSNGDSPTKGTRSAALAAELVVSPFTGSEGLARRFQQRLSLDRRRARRSHPRARHAGHPLPAARPTRSLDGSDRVRAAAGASTGLFHDETAFAM